MIGTIVNLEIKRYMPQGAYLDAGALGEILIPMRYVSRETMVGDILRVFVYLDSEERPIATTLEPKAIVGEVAVMTVRTTDDYGAFVDWGLDGKDLLIPFREQRIPLEAGKPYPIYVYFDERSNRIVGTTKLSRHFHNQGILPYTKGEEVALIIAQRTELGYKALINKKHWGIIYHNEVFRPLRIGAELTGYIKALREENKIDLALQKQGYSEIENASAFLLQKLQQRNGILPLTDQTPPEVIYQTLGMSKKTFKKAVGALYKQQLIILTEQGITLKEESPQ